MSRINDGTNKWYWILLGGFALATLFLFFLCFYAPEHSPSKPVDSDTSAENTDAADSGETPQVEEALDLILKFQEQLSSSYLILVDDSHPLPEDYDPALTTVKQNTDLRMVPAAAKALEEFWDEATSAGFSPVIRVAYRSRKEQNKVFDDAAESYMNAGYTSEKAQKMARMDSGDGDTSEHRLGLAFDFSEKCLSDVNDEGVTFRDFAAGNLPKHGFTLTFPEGAEAITGRKASAVHYRYVGPDAATVMSERDMALPQYLDYLQSQIDYQCQLVESLKKK